MRIHWIVLWLKRLSFALLAVATIAIGLTNVASADGMGENWDGMSPLPTNVEPGWSVIAYQKEYWTITRQIDRPDLNSSWTECVHYLGASIQNPEDYYEVYGYEDDGVTPFYKVWVQYRSEVYGSTNYWDTIVSHNTLHRTSSVARSSVFADGFGGPTHYFNGYGLILATATGIQDEYQDTCSTIPASLDDIKGDSRLWTDKFVVQYDPVASFTFEMTNRSTREVTFTNTSHDPDGNTGLNFSWNFGDESLGSTEENPVHTFPTDKNIFNVSLTVTDPDGNIGSTTREVRFELPLVVNSTADTPATDPEVGCDTGGSIDGDPECTLRAALEVAAAGGGDTITFDIDSPGIPTINVSDQLPAIETSLALDGSTQPGSARVNVVGSGEKLLGVTGGSVELRGLTLSGAQAPLMILGGSNHVVIDVFLGTNADGTAPDNTAVFGVAVDGGEGVSLKSLVTGSTLGVNITNGTNVSVTNSFLGVAKDGSTPLGEPKGGLAIQGGSGITVSENVVRGSTVGIASIGSTPSGVTITENKVGVAANGSSTFSDLGYAIRVDGTPGAVVSDNVLFSDVAPAVVAVSGRAEVTEGDQLEFNSPDSNHSNGPITGTGIVVSNNKIGLSSSGSPLADVALVGITVWSGADSADISGNSIAGSANTGILVADSTGVVVRGNKVGKAAAAGADATTTGIAVSDSANIQVGANSDGNEIEVTETAIRIEDSTPASVLGNTISKGTRGVEITGSENVTVSTNVIDKSTEIAIDVVSPGAKIHSNVVTPISSGIRISGEGAELKENRIGVPRGSDIPGSATGTGILVVDGFVTLTSNVLAGFADGGIVTTANGSVAMLHNRVWAVGEAGFVSHTALTNLKIAALRTGSGDTERIALLLSDTPAEGGRFEVFASDSCATGPAFKLTGIERTVKPNSLATAVSVKNMSYDNFTVVFTTPDGVSHGFSACAEAEAATDADGDGSPDVFDELGGHKNDPTTGVILTDTDDLLMISLVSPDPSNPDAVFSGGKLTGLSAVDDPTPHQHPSGWSMPYGAIKFRIEDVEPGGLAAVRLADISDNTPKGNSYWKYGPTGNGQTGWYDFSPDEATNTGAYMTNTYVNEELGVRSVFVLALRDGGRGDSDGTPDGVITDPGGPVIFDGSTSGSGTQVPPGVVVPTAPPSTVPTNESSNSPSTTVPGDMPNSDDSVAPEVKQHSQTETLLRGRLPITGTAAMATLALGFTVLVAGALFVVATRLAARE